VRKMTNYTAQHHWELEQRW